MSCKKIIEDGLVRILQQADNLGHSSIALPPIGSGIAGVQIDQVAAAIYGAVGALRV